MFVIDRSGSMACNLPEDGQSTETCEAFPVQLDPELPTKWQLTKEAINTAIAELRDAGTVRLGLSLFPKTGSLCSLSIDPDIPVATLDEEQQSKVLKALDTVDPSGDTPLAGATILSYAYFLDRMKEGALDGETYVVLVTDGYESCKSNELSKLINQDVPNAREQLGIRTFVIGVPGSEGGRALLSEIAVMGGTETSSDCSYGRTPDDGNCHYDMTKSTGFSTNLLTALAKVNAEALSCIIDIPSASGGTAVNLEEVNVIVNGQSRVMKNEGACSTTNGWRYAPDFSSILLCGDTCRAAKQRGAEVTVILGCPTVLQ
jgi:hypothetical protein